MKWSKNQLNDVCIRITDGKHGDCLNEDDSGYYFISAKDVINGVINYDNARQITKQDFLDSHKRTRFEPHDVIISNSGTLGRMAVAKDNELTLRTTFQKSVALLKPNFFKVDSYFLYYCILANLESLISLGSGTAQKNLLLKDIRSFEISLPPLSTQRRIASILSAYDDLIENNLRRIKLLEEAARCEYKMLMEENETTRQSVLMLGKVITGKTPSTSNKAYFNGEVPFVKTPDMHSQIVLLNTEQTLSKEGADSQPNKYLPEGSIMVSCIGTAGVVAIAGKECQTNQQINSIIPNEDYYSSFLYFEFKQRKEELEALGSNGSTFTNVNKSKFETIQIDVPSDDSLKEFHTNAQPNFQLIKILSIQNTQLRQARDLLLPKLMSGEIDVEESSGTTNIQDDTYEGSMAAEDEVAYQ